MAKVTHLQTFTGNGTTLHVPEDAVLIEIPPPPKPSPDVVFAAGIDDDGKEGDFYIEGRHVFIDGHFMLTLAEGVKFDVLQEILTLKDREERGKKERASLAVYHTRLAHKVNDLERRLLNSERREKILKARVNILERPEIEKKSIGSSLRQARQNNNERRLSKAEQELDEYTFKVFDLDERLDKAGGHYVLQNIIDDILLIHPETKESDFEVDLDDVIASAMRWCDRRTCYWRNKRFWIEKVGEFLIIKRNRFLFQAKEDPPEAIRV